LSIAQAIEAVDVPADYSQSLLSNMNRMQVYRLTGVDPEPVVKTLTQLGNLSPNTRLEVDKKNKAIIAYASLVDHVMIRAVIDKLSGSERKFEVIPLHRLPSDFVAGSIMFMMGIEPKKKKERSNPWGVGASRTRIQRDYQRVSGRRRRGAQPLDALCQRRGVGRGEQPAGETG